MSTVKTYSTIAISGLFFLLLFLSACSTQTERPGALNSSGIAPQKEERRPVLSSDESRKVEWEKTLEAAKKEGRVVIYAASTGPAIKDAIGIFKQKYGLALEVVSGRGGEVSRKLITERSNGLFIVDVFNVGMNNNLGEAKPAGALDPLESVFILPEISDPKAWIGGELPWGDKDRLVFKFFAYPSSPIGINTIQAKPEEIKSYYDLLSPKWKSKIAMNDPTLAGIGFNSFSSLIYNKALDLDFFRQLIQQQPVVVRDQRLQIDWVAKGRYAVALWPQPAPFAEYREAGAPITFIPTPAEGTQLAVGGGSLSIVNRAPHPNAARVFINWLLSKEGQLYMQTTQQLQSARVDISTEGLDPFKRRKDGEKYFMGANTIEEWIVKEQNRYEELSKQVFEPLLR